jgi:vancomycin resistance protein YoaR
MKFRNYIIQFLLIIFFLSGNPLFADDQLFVIASFTTSIAEQDDNVKTNIMIACKRLDGVIIPPKSTFSFNDTVGEGTSRNGYMMGRVLYRDKTVMEPGGGLCQVSSTLFNALMLAGCAIKERHRHFQPVSYVPLGLDATIKYGKKDLKIKNPYDFSIRIEMKTTDKSLITKVLSEKSLTNTYEMVTEEETISIPVTQENPVTMENDRIREGISVLVYRKRFNNSRFVESALLYKDYYPPVFEE